MAPVRARRLVVGRCAPLFPPARRASSRPERRAPRRRRAAQDIRRAERQPVPRCFGRGGAAGRLSGDERLQRRGDGRFRPLRPDDRRRAALVDRRRLSPPRARAIQPDRDHRRAHHAHRDRARPRGGGRISRRRSPGAGRGGGRGTALRRRGAEPADPAAFGRRRSGAAQGFGGARGPRTARRGRICRTISTSSCTGAATG